MFFTNQSKYISSRSCTRYQGDNINSAFVITIWSAMGLAGQGVWATLCELVWNTQAAWPPGGGDFFSLLWRRWHVSRRDASAQRGAGRGRSVSDFFLENASSEMSSRRRLPPTPTPSLGQESSPGMWRRRSGAFLSPR